MTAIQWTDRVWNPVSGCTKVSKGCQHCYAERQADRKLPKGGFTDRPFTEVRTHANRLDIPLHWRKPQRVFVNSMSDLFHEDVPGDFIDQVFAVMALCPQHTFQVLTKRPWRMRDYLSGSDYRNEQISIEAESMSGTDRHTEDLQPRWRLPLPNVWLGVSVEDQATADERIPVLLETLAALRWVSYEPALGPVDFGKAGGLPVYRFADKPIEMIDGLTGRSLGFSAALAGSWRRHDGNMHSWLNWIVVGGESGPGARPFDIAWARRTVEQCKAAGVACFVKQLGARPVYRGRDDDSLLRMWLNDRKGGDIEEWLADLRVREWPEVRS